MKDNAFFKSLPEWVKNQWPIYCGHYSKEFTALFLKVLSTIADPWTKQQLWDKFTNYTAHGDVAGESAKMYFTNHPDAERLNRLLDYLYDAWDRDEKHIREKQIDQELEQVKEALKKEGCFNLINYMMAEINWRRDRALHGGDWPVEKILDYLKLD